MLIKNGDKGYEIKWGADPEYFAGKIIDGEVYVIPSEFFRMEGLPIVVEDRKHPQFFNDGKGHIIHQDGVAFEISLPARGSWIELLKDTWNMQDKIDELLSGFSKYTDGCFAIPVAKYDFEHWNTFGKRMMMSNIFGCDQDYNACGSKALGEVVDATCHPTRYFGGHIHTSGHPLYKEYPITCVKVFAMTGGLAASAYSPVPKMESDRTFLYGKFDKFRPQNYPDGSTGVEYRTPSVTWTKRGNAHVAEKVFQYMTLGIEAYLSSVDKALAVFNEIENQVKEAILSCDQPKCLELLSYVESKA